MSTMMDGHGPAVDVANVSVDVAAVLLAHARHADTQLLDACEPLSGEQLDRSFEMGPGSLRATLTEILAAMRAWSDIYAGRDTRPWMGDEGPFTLDALRAMAGELHDDWAAIAGHCPLDGVIERQGAGKTVRFTRAQILTHVFTHSVHHRAQAINMLRHVTGLPAAGGSDGPSLPSGSVTHWVAASTSSS